MIYEERIQRESKFYNECARILGIKYTYNPPFRRRTRWNVRTLGNSRFAGYGIIQMFNSTVIQVMFKGNSTKVFESEQEVFEFLKELKNENR